MDYHLSEADQAASVSALRRMGACRAHSVLGRSRTQYNERGGRVALKAATSRIQSEQS